jgi:putative MATE family efflux protein
MGVILKELDTKKLLSIALPVSVQSLIQSFLGMIDQMMIGQLGENIVAAVSLGGRPGFILIYTLSGITAAASIFASQYEGAGDKSRHAQVMRSTIFGCLLITLPFLLSAIFIREILLKAFTTDTAVISAGTGYLKICSLSYIPLIFIMACSAILRSTGEANLPMITGIVAVAVNTMLNAILIFGMFGVPALGAEGAAIATVISYLIEAIILIAYMQKKSHGGNVVQAFKARCPKDFAWLFFVTALPAVGNELLWALGDAGYTAIYGRLGTQQLAAMALTFPVQGLTVGFFTGLSAAAGIIIGNLQGAQKTKEAYTTAWDFFKLSVIGCFFMGVILVACTGLYVSFYNVSSEVAKLAKQLLIIFAFFLWVKVSNMVVLGGVIRSGGQTKYTLFLDVLGTWGIGIPLGIIAAFLLKLDIRLVYTIISIEEIVRLILGLTRVKSKKWMKTLV